ncbi:hypothetical protein QO207_01510 [Pseudomonas sp. CAN2814]|uniref:hypothetical protein n=1 Tax=Pseudomonas sp. CAN1 TaxID=3046726 RepID=UPI0026491829|nr:hypothetical protein [Pseudomonas sp. CAN1]MDN6855248.1 hypothetical protein [Pseudomonas sp. CAN1]
MRSEESTRALNFWLYLAVFIAICGAILHGHFGYSTPASGNALGSDDAFISYRYAANLSSGLGLIFTPGESVEGYSNLLYTLLMVPGVWLGADSLYFFSLVVNALLLGGCCIVFHNLIKDYLGERWAAVGVMLLALSPVLWANAATGLESVLVLFLVLLVWSAVDRLEPDLRVLLALALACSLCRVDGFTIPLLAAVALALSGKRKVALQLTLFVVLVMGLYTFWRLYYYNDYIANTFHAKITGGFEDRLKFGFRMLWMWGRFNGLLAFMVMTALLALMRRDLVHRHPFPFVLLSATVGYFIYIGGDIYFERFLLSVIPVGLFAVLHLAAGVRQTPLKFALPLFALLAGSLVLHEDARFSYREKTYDMWYALGRFLKQANPSYLLAIDAAGKVPFYSGLPSLDLLGLNDRHIGRRTMPANIKFFTAHSKFDPDYVLSRNPELIASWVLPSLDLAWGMTQERYGARYELKYLVSASLESRGKDILDVQGMRDEQIRSLVDQYYNYGVLARKDIISSLPRADMPEPPPTLAQDGLLDPDSATGFAGWFGREGDIRWSNGKRAATLFRISPKTLSEGRLEIRFGALGSQRVALRLNGHSLGEFQLQGWDERLVIPIDPRWLLVEADNELEWDLPDARTPGTGDPRTLAIALRELRLR